MHILGIHAFHDAGAALIHDGEIVAAVSEERLARIKHYCGFPTRSIEWVLSQGGCSVDEVDYVAINGIGYLTAVWRYVRQFGVSRLPKKVAAFLRPRLAGTSVTEGLYEDRVNIVQQMRAAGLRAPVVTIDHHLGHAAYAYRTSGWERATVVTLDGSGDWLAGSVYAASSGRLTKLGETYIHGGSLGHFYSSVTQGLGFKVNDGEGKTMALACYAQPDAALEAVEAYAPYVEGLSLHKVYEWAVHGEVREHVFHVTFDEAAVFRQLSKRVSREAVASAAQSILERLVAELIQRAIAKTGVRDVALAGGLFLNVKASHHLISQGLVDRVWVPPHPGDGGLPIGYALEAYSRVTRTHVSQALENPYIGPSYDDRQIEAALKEAPAIRYLKQTDAIGAACQALLEGKVVGWVQGPMEWGPRALGARSVLADPRNRAVKDRINHSLKRREWFMPFAPSVLPEYASEWFECYQPSPFMNLAFTVAPSKREQIPAVVHVDGTARPHTVNRVANPRYAQLLDRFYTATGIPMVLNTSFNRHGVPVVCSPADAVDHLQRGCVDVLVIGDYVVERVPDAALETLDACHETVAKTGLPTT